MGLRFIVSVQKPVAETSQGICGQNLAKPYVLKGVCQIRKSMLIS
ncbi:hypothetical protein FM109_14930 [Vibrio casei]|nr:hypothetical protein FM109_14930 [Vibrio casei]